MASVLVIGAEHQALSRALRGEPGLVLVGGCPTASALSQIARTAPDLVLLAVTQPRDLAVAGEVMAEAPRPVLVVGASVLDPGMVRQAKDLGVVEVCRGLPSPTHPEYEHRRAHLARMVRVFAKVPVVTQQRRRTTGSEVPAAPGATTPPPLPPPLPARAPRLPRNRLLPRLVVIGASTGGPPALEQVLRALPSSFDVPLALVQHMTVGFGREFARWLSEVAQRPVVVVDERMVFEPGRLYLAPEERHLVVASPTELAPSDSGERRFQKPSVDVLFESAARVLGPATLAVLMTGMGSDGVEGMVRLKECGATTVAQSPASCVVDSMPRGAIDRHVVDVEAGLQEIAALLAECGG